MTATASIAVSTFRQREEKPLPGSLHAPSRKPPGSRRGGGDVLPPPLRSRHSRSENPRRRFRPALRSAPPVAHSRVPHCPAGVKRFLRSHLGSFTAFAVCSSYLRPAPSLPNVSLATTKLRRTTSGI